VPGATIVIQAEAKVINILKGFNGIKHSIADEDFEEVISNHTSYFFQELGFTGAEKLSNIA